MSYVNWQNKENGKDIASADDINEAFASIEKSFSSANDTYATKNELDTVNEKAEQAQRTADSADGYVTQAQSTADYAAQGVDALNPKVENLENKIQDIVNGGIVVGYALETDKATMDSRGNVIVDTYATYENCDTALHSADNANQRLDALEPKVGEIETALDAILEIQNSLIGGEA